MFLWRPIDRLLAKARAARQKALDEDAANMDPQQESTGGEHLIPGSVAQMLYSSRNDARSSATTSPPALSNSSSLSPMGPQPTFGSLMDDRFKVLKASDMRSPELSTQSQPGNQQEGVAARAESPTSYLEANVPSFNGNANMGDWLESSKARTPIKSQDTMDSTMSFGGDNPNNFTMAHVLAASNGFNNNISSNNNDNIGNNVNINDPTQMGDMSMTFDANGDLDWANWDNMVRQFGMDVDQGPDETMTNQVMPWNAPMWNGIGNGPGGLGQSDWF